MPILTSPVVAITELDYSQVVPLAATGAAAICGQFASGPMYKPILCTSVADLTNNFGAPKDYNYKEWFQAYNFLQYSSTLWVVRIAPQTTAAPQVAVMNAGAASASPSTGIQVFNADVYEQLEMTGASSLTAVGEFICKQPGSVGNGLSVIVVDAFTWPTLSGANVATANWTAANYPYYFSEGLPLVNYCRQGQPGTSSFASTNAANPTLRDEITIFVIDTLGKVTGVAGRILEQWEGLSKLLNATDYLGRNVYYQTFLNNYSAWIWAAGAISTGSTGSATITNATWSSGVATFTAANGFAVGDSVVITNVRVEDVGTSGFSGFSGDSGFSGTSGISLRYNGTYTVTAATGTTFTVAISVNPGTYVSGGSATFTIVSPIAWGTATSGAAITGVFAPLSALYNVKMAGGVGGDSTDYASDTAGTAKGSDLNTGYALFLNKDVYQIAYFILGDFPILTQKYVIESVCEVRQDAIGFVTPNNGGIPFFNPTTIVTDLANWRNVTLDEDTSFAVCDSGYKYQFDGYNQKYRWVPLAADVAGLCANCDANYQSWNSPAGFTRGQIKGALKLSSNLNQSERDILYPMQINPVVAFPGKGTVLFGDRTMLGEASAFQAIHIRRMFIIIEQSIQIAARNELFELNTPTTRNLFVGMITPFLQGVQANNGLAAFDVFCNSKNNTDDVVASGQFNASIYVQPLYSIQWIVLSFVAVKSAVEFNILISASGPAS